MFPYLSPGFLNVADIVVQFPLFLSCDNAVSSIFFAMLAKLTFVTAKFFLAIIPVPSCAQIRIMEIRIIERIVIPSVIKRISPIHPTHDHGPFISAPNAVSSSLT
jgi:hypothetical protein